VKLLVVSQLFPYPPINGAKQRAYHLIKGLAQRHEVHLLTFAQTPEDLNYTDEVRSMCADLRMVPGKEYRPTRANALRAFFSSRPRSSIDRWSEEMSRLVLERTGNHRFDATIALTTLSAEYLLRCRIPRILDNDNADSAYFARLAGLNDNSMAKFRRKLTWVKVAGHERRLVAAFDATLTVSEEDKRELERLLPSAKKREAIHVVANGVDLGLVGYQGPSTDPRCIISTGALTYHANLDATAFFCEQILPSIRRDIPDVRFLVTGRHDGVDTAALAAAGAELTGFLDDIRPAVAGSAALVVPTRIGGGTRLKILEAMALGAPVVSTTLGAMGLGLRHGETALLADDPAEFAECTLRLMRDAELRGRIVENARRYVAANFGWERSVDALEQVVQSVVRRPGPASVGHS
jgi:sugar transferase (PEP-CTERM/EpsH1 system associated)